MKLTFHGHSAFTVEATGQKLLIDPFLKGNPKFTGDFAAVTAGTTAVLLTHGHNDHFGDTLEILEAQSAPLVAIVEICNYASSCLSGMQSRPMNMGGTVALGGVSASFVRAAHSSAYTDADGTVHYMGEPGGFVVQAAGEPTVYFMGDTDVIPDFEIIAERFKPDIVVAPIGGNYTMDGAGAAWAVNRYFPNCTAIPCHYMTFPILAQDDTGFAGNLRSGVTYRKMESGQTITV